MREPSRMVATDFGRSWGFGIFIGAGMLILAAVMSIRWKRTSRFLRRHRRFPGDAMRTEEWWYGTPEAPRRRVVVAWVVVLVISGIAFVQSAIAKL